MIDSAARMGQAGTVIVLTGTGFQTATFEHLPGAHLYHALDALIAAEALSRT